MTSLVGDVDVAAVDAFFARDDAEDRRLAGAVGADEADLVARTDLKARVLIEDTVAVLLGDIGKMDHGFPFHNRFCQVMEWP